MKLKQKMVRAALALRSVSLSEIKTDKGVLVYAGDSWENGTEVFFIDANNESVPAGDGVYVEEATGKSFEVKDGKIVLEVEASEDVEALVNELIALRGDVESLRSELNELRTKVETLLGAPAEGGVEVVEQRATKMSKIGKILKH